MEQTVLTVLPVRKAHKVLQVRKDLLVLME
jgi:hypothetical protein